MIDDDFDSQEIFDGAIELQRHERGESFGLDPMCYFRMARMSNDANSMGIHPSMICKLPGGERGCRLTLFGKTHSFDLIVRVFRSWTTLALFAEPLDGLRCEIPLYEGQDCDAHWSCALRSMLATEGTHYADQHWAQEQQGGEDEAASS